MAFLGAFAFGTTATENPSLAASFNRSWPRGAGRTSPRQVDLAEGEEAARQRPGAQAALDRQHHRQVGGGLADAHPADRVDEDILVAGRDACMAVQHRQHHRQAVALDAHAQAARARPAGVDQGLHLDQQRRVPSSGGKKLKVVMAPVGDDEATRSARALRWKVGEQ